MNQALLHIRALQRASELKGGENALANHLGVAVVDVRRWRAGRAPVPGDVFLRVADILADHAIAQLRQGAERH